MSEWKELAWVTCADSAEGAIELIMNEFDMTGVEVDNWKAEAVPQNYVVYNVGF